MYSGDLDVLLHNSLKTKKINEARSKKTWRCVFYGNFSYKWANIYYSQTTLYSQIAILLSRKDSADY